MFRRLRPLLLSLTLALAAANGQAQEAATSTQPLPDVLVTLVHVNDLDRLEESHGRGGLARLAGLLAAERAKGHRVIFTHGGDAISPSLLSAFDAGAHMIALLGRLQPDAMVLGNHEFDFGPTALRQRLAEAKFPMLAANLTAGDGPVPGLAPESIVEEGGFRIGIVGVTTPRAATTSQTGTLRLGEMQPAAEKALRALAAKGCDLRILLVHGTQEDDAALAAALPETDILLSGDDRKLTVSYDGRLLTAEAAAEADYVPVIDLTLHRSPALDGAPAAVSWTPQFRIVDTATVAPDPEVQARIDDAMAVLDAQLDAPIGTVEVALDSRRATLRNGDSSFGSLVAEAMRQSTGADAALMNGGGIRADRLYPAGSALTARQVVEELPFGNHVTLVQATGAQLQAALDHGVAERGRGAARFPQLAGVTGRIAADAQGVRHVEDVQVGGQPLDPERSYRLATSDYLASGGDGYTMLRPAPSEPAATPGPLLSTVVIDYIRSQKRIAPLSETHLRFD